MAAKKGGSTHNTKTKETKAARIAEIREFLLQGNIRTPLIIAEFAERFGCGTDLIYKYFQEVNNEIFGDLSTFKDQYKLLIAARLEELYDKTKAVSDFKEARQNLAQLSKMYGLDAPTEVKVESTNIKFNFGIDNE